MLSSPVGEQQERQVLCNVVSFFRQAAGQTGAVQCQGADIAILTWRLKCIAFIVAASGTSRCGPSHLKDGDWRPHATHTHSALGAMQLRIQQVMSCQAPAVCCWLQVLRMLAAVDKAFIKHGLPAFHEVWPPPSCMRGQCQMQITEHGGPCRSQDCRPGSKPLTAMVHWLG